MAPASQANAKVNTETVTLRLPSGEEVDAVVPAGMSDEQVKGLMQQKHPEFFQQAPAQQRTGDQFTAANGASLRLGSPTGPAEQQLIEKNARQIAEGYGRSAPMMMGGGIATIGEELAPVSGFLGRVNSGIRKAVGLAPATEKPRIATPGEHLQSVVAADRTRAAQPPFPNRAEGLPEVEEAQPIAEQHLRNAVATPHESQPLPPVKPAKVEKLLNEATGAKPLISNVPLKNQLDRVTPVTVPKESSVVASHSYDPAAQELTVKTKNGGEYVHGDVTPEQADAFAKADSKGKAWNDIRNNSTLVAKVVNGKRVPIKPAGARIADPNDLTPVLRDSVQQAIAKKK